MKKIEYVEYQKWNIDKRCYEPYYVPADKKLVYRCDDYDTVIDCCQCLKPLKYGESYCSKEVHTPNLGFGYAVCEKCHNEEWERLRNKLKEDPEYED